MFLRTSGDYRQAVSAAENCLRQLPIEFRRNGTATVTEFEVIAPAYFRIVIEPNKMPRTWNFLMPSISPPEGSTIEIVYGIDETDETAASAMAKSFLRAFARSLPEDPWKGLPSRESAKEERRWKEIILSEE